MANRDPTPRAVLVASTRRLLDFLALDHISALTSGRGPVPHGLLAPWFEAWVEDLGRAPSALLEAHSLRAILEEALVEAQLKVTDRYAGRLGESRVAEALRGFAGSLDLAHFADARGRSYMEWLSRAVRLPEPAARIPTPDDDALRERIDKLTPDERMATTELEVASGAGTLRDLTPLRGLPRLRKLVLSDANRVVDLSPLGALAALEDLSLGGPRIVDLRPLEPLRGLRRLKLHMTGVNDLSALAALESLEDLELDDTPFGGLRCLARLPLRRLHLRKAACDLAPLAGMRTLRELCLTWTAQTTNLDAIGELVDLRVLGLSELPFESVELLSRLTALVDLTLSSCEALRDIRAIAGLRSLESLDLGLSPLADTSALAGLPDLRVLNLFGSAARALPPLAQLPRLEKLSLLCVELESLQGLEAAHALRSFEIASTKVSDLTPLSGLHGLESLDFASQGAITDIEPLRGLRGLKDLRLDGAHVRDLEPISGLASLERVAFPRTLIESVEPLAGLPRLRSVDVTQCHHLETLLPLAACACLEEIECSDCERLRGPQTVEELRSWRPPRSAKTYPPAAPERARPGAVTVLDARNHLPRQPPEGWSAPERSLPPGGAEAYFLEAEGVLVQVALIADEDHPHLLVTIAPRDRRQASDKLVARILRRLRACEPFVEMSDDRLDVLPDGLEFARCFAARAHPASPDTWGAIRERGPLLRVEPGDAGAAGSASGELDVRNHLPAPLPEGWRLERTGEPEGASCRIMAPEGMIVAFVRLEEGSDVATLAVGIFPPQGGPPYVTDDRARASLEGFRARGAFAELGEGPYAEGPGVRFFAARVGK